MSLYERMQRYENITNYTLLPNLPIVVKCSIRNFSKLIRKLPRPYCNELWNIIKLTMHSTVMELEGAVFAYQQHSNIYYVLKNFEENSPGPYGSKIQKINSVITSLTSLNFLKNYLASDEPPDIIGEAIFESNCFSTPSIVETVNYIISQQEACKYYAVSIVAEEELSEFIENISKRSIKEKIKLLSSECGIIFERDYDSNFRLGTCSFKAPKIMKTENQEIIRKKWILENAFSFYEESDFLNNIINTGQDILRPERDIQ